MKASDPTQDQLTRWINEGLKDLTHRNSPESMAANYTQIARSVVTFTDTDAFITKPQNIKEFIEWEKKERTNPWDLTKVVEFDGARDAMKRQGYDQGYDYSVTKDLLDKEEPDYDEYYPPLTQCK